MWKVLVVAFGVVLVLEGIFPFLSPIHYKAFLEKMSQQPDTVLRKIGAVVILVGVMVVIVMQRYFGL